MTYLELVTRKKVKIRTLYLFYRELKTSTLLNILRSHSRDDIQDHRSFLALCYALRKRGFDV